VVDLSASAGPRKCNDNAPGFGPVDPEESNVLAWLSTSFARTRISGGRRLNAAEMNSLALLMYQGRRDRERYFDAGLFSDPAWDILLAAYCLPTSERPLSITGLCYASAVPPTTALRWIKHLCVIGLLTRSPSSDDARVVFVELTQSGRAKMEDYLGDFSNRISQPKQDD
jgi:DNA-binding MarR family transcriptional regulator